MLYNKISLSNTLDSCLVSDDNYAFSLYSYIVEEGGQTNLYVELDSFISHINNITNKEDVIVEIEGVETIKLIKKKIRFTTKNFVYYKHLNPVIAIICFYLKRLDRDNQKAKEAIGHLYNSIITSWVTERKRVERLFKILDKG